MLGCVVGCVEEHTNTRTHTRTHAHTQIALHLENNTANTLANIHAYMHPGMLVLYMYTTRLTVSSKHMSIKAACATAQVYQQVRTHANLHAGACRQKHANSTHAGCHSPFAWRDLMLVGG